MQVAVRSCLTAGVAAVSAAALIAAPVMPTPTEIKVPAIYSAQVNLTAASNPSRNPPIATVSATNPILSEACGPRASPPSVLVMR